MTSETVTPELKLYAGKPPQHPEWTPLTCFEVDGTPWSLAMRPSVRGWTQLKLYALKPVPRKGNFWLAWNTPEQRFADNHDGRSLSTHRPELHKVLLEFLQTHFHAEASA